MEVNFFKQCLTAIPDINTERFDLYDACICMLAFSAIYLFVRLNQTQKVLKNEMQSVRILSKRLSKEREFNQKLCEENAKLVNEIVLRLVNIVNYE